MSREEVPGEVIAKEKAIFMEQAANSGKPEHILERIVEGQVNKWLSEICLVEQPFVKNPDVTIQSLITDQIASLGENIKVNRFSRMEIGG